MARRDFITIKPTHVVSEQHGDFTNGGDLGWATVTRDGEDVVLTCKTCGESHRMKFGPVMIGGHFEHAKHCRWIVTGAADDRR